MARGWEKSMKKVGFAMVAFLAAAGVIGFVARGGGSFPASSSSGGVSAVGGASAAPVPATRDFAPGERAPTQAGVPGTISSDSAGILGQSALPGVGAEVIKDARIGLQVKRGGLQSALEAATSAAGQFGGFVQSSSSSDRSGSILIRVPAASFESALNALKGLGTVKSQTVSGRDVTSQFVDLNARLITWRSQETVLLRLMDQATSISDTLRIQSQLQQVQFRIEQIRGALRVLRDQTSYGTIELGVREVGAPASTPKTTGAPSLARAWQLSWAGFLGVISAVVVGLGYLVPLTVLGLVGWAVSRRAIRLAAGSS
jgi:hypothetical protein